MKFQKTIITSLSLIALSACVSSSKYDETVTEMENMRKSLGDTQEELTASQEQLTASQAEIATLRKIEAETKRRNEIYAEFVNKLQSMIDRGQLTVSIDAGRIVINLPDNVLFNSGSASLNPEGRQAITQVGEVLSQFSDRRFQIEGHTDTVPIKSARYPSNWELSTARALSVVHLMTEIGVNPENISAAGFGEYRPRADNENEEGKQLNRRIEIVMLPNLDILSSELPKVTSQ